LVGGGKPPLEAMFLVCMCGGERKKFRPGPFERKWTERGTLDIWILGRTGLAEKGSTGMGAADQGGGTQLGPHGEGYGKNLVGLQRKVKAQMVWWGSEVCGGVGGGVAGAILGKPA